SSLVISRSCAVHSVLFLSIFVFFFQAEDGIRDWSVTGVQTCALPILRHVMWLQRRLLEQELDADRLALRRHSLAVFDDEAGLLRSEERRVGEGGGVGGGAGC